MPHWYMPVTLVLLGLVLLALGATAIHTSRSVSADRPIDVQPIRHDGATEWWSPRNDIAVVSHPEAELLAEARREIQAVTAELRPMMDACRQHMEQAMREFDRHVTEAMATFHVSPVDDLTRVIGPVGQAEAGIRAFRLETDTVEVYPSQLATVLRASRSS